MRRAAKGGRAATAAAAAAEAALATGAGGTLGMRFSGAGVRAGAFAGGATLPLRDAQRRHTQRMHTSRGQRCVHVPLLQKLQRRRGMAERHGGPLEKLAWMHGAPSEKHTPQRTQMRHVQHVQHARMQQVQGMLNMKTQLQQMQTARGTPAGAGGRISMHGTGMDMVQEPTLQSQSQPQPQWRRQRERQLPRRQEQRGFAAAAAAAAGMPVPASQDDEGVHERRHLRSAHAVKIALMTNAGVFLGKSAVWALTGSAVMAAEAVHSAVDTMNQYALRTGLLRSLRPPDSKHPYGYSKEQFVWSLASSVAFFCLGAAASVTHGVHSLLHPQAMTAFDLQLGAGSAVLSMALESYSCAVAYRAIVDSAKAENMTFSEYTSDGDPVSVAVFFEDVSAVVGSGIAFAALNAAYWLDEPVWDACGSLGVGLLLAVTAAKLFSRNHRSLVGVSMPDRDLARAVEVLKQCEIVASWRDMKTEVLGPRKFRFKCEIVVDGAAIVSRHPGLFDGMEGALGLGGGGGGGAASVATGAAPRGGAGAGGGGMHTDTAGARRVPDAPLSGAALDDALRGYGSRVVDVVPLEIERLERLLKEAVPGIQHVDIELVREK